MTLLKGRKKRAWWPFLPTGPSNLGVDSKVMGFRVMPNGSTDPIGQKTPSHSGFGGNTAIPRNKRRTPRHQKGVPYPGQWRSGK